MQNVVVLGGAYAGAHAFHILGNGLGNGFRVIMIDRNTHVNFVYTFARYAVLPGHEHKAFIPFKGVLKPVKASDPDPPPTRHIILHARIIALSPHEVTIDRTFPELGFDSPVIPYRFAVYALGSRLPASIDFWTRDENAIGALTEAEKPVGAMKHVEMEFDGTKPEGIEWFKHCQDRVRKAESILCVGGGALGIQFATDVKSHYPEKQVTLLHSRNQLLPRFDYELHREVLKSIEDLQIYLILGERLDLDSKVKDNGQGRRVVKTDKGREIVADLILLCTGQLPNTDFLEAMSPRSIDPKTKLAYVLPTMQLGIIPSTSDTETHTLPDVGRLRLEDESASSTEAPIAPEQGSVGVAVEKLPETPYPHIFVAGDCADVPGAIKAGHTAYWEAEVAARNIIRLAQWETQTDSTPGIFIESEGKNKDQNNEAQSDKQKDPLDLETYHPGPPAIKVTLGIGRTSAYQFNGMVGRKNTPEADDLDASMAWAFFGILDVKPEDMYD